MKTYFFRLMGLMGIAFAIILPVYCYFAVWQTELPDKYTQTIDFDASSLAGAEVLPAEKVKPGTFRVTKDFNEISGGIVTYDFSYNKLMLERWKGRGDGVFDYAVAASQSIVSPNSFYEERGIIWTGTDFQIIFEKDGDTWILIVFSSFVILVISGLVIGSTFPERNAF